MNTSRAPIVDQAALVRALEEGRIAGAGLDVFETEPLPADSPFRRLPNVLALPHVGYVTRTITARSSPRPWRISRRISPVPDRLLG